MHYPISLCYHPTTAVFIDDNPDFINIVKFQLGKTLYCHFYTDPQKALQFFKNEYRPAPFTQRCFVEMEDEPLDHLIYNIDLRQIHNEIYFAERFAEIAVVIVDYTMPHLNGLALSHAIKAINPAIRIVLLTGEADHDLAVKAFNENSIDKFIKKDTPELINIITQAIKELEHQYFARLSNSILHKLNTLPNCLLDRLQDPHIVRFFNQLCQNNSIIEYYLINNNGSFLLIDNKGNPYWLALLTDKELHDFYEYAASEKAPPSVIKPLQQKTKLPFFYTRDDLRTPPCAWEKYLHPAQQIIGAATYYYALITDANAYQWHLTDVVLYKDYLAKAS